MAVGRLVLLKVLLHHSPKTYMDSLMKTKWLWVYLWIYPVPLTLWIQKFY
nr:unnamed protein product [Callosobruchus analis]